MPKAGTLSTWELLANHAQVLISSSTHHCCPLRCSQLFFSLTNSIRSQVPTLALSYYKLKLGCLPLFFHNPQNGKRSLFSVLASQTLRLRNIGALTGSNSDVLPRSQHSAHSVSLRRGRSLPELEGGCARSAYNRGRGRDLVSSAPLGA